MYAARRSRSTGFSSVRKTLPGATALRPSPLRRTLLEEGAHALLGVVGASVHGHHGLRQVVGAVLVELDLGIERLFADAHRQWARSRDRLDELRDLAIERILGHDAIHQAPLECGGGVDRAAREQHLERP